MENLLVDTQNFRKWQKSLNIQKKPLFVDDKFVTNFLEKAKLFNEFFSKQYQPLQNNSTLPKSNTYHTENRLNDITFDNDIFRCKQSSWVRWYFNKNAKVQQPYHDQTTFYYISELPAIWNFPRRLEKRKHCTGS